MSRDKAALLDICKAGQEILAYSQGLDRSALKSDQMRVSAILYQVLIIGEATKRLSQEFRSQYPQIPWDNMAGMRDIIAHQYDRLDFDILWNVIHQGVPNIIEQITPLLPKEASE